MKKKIINMLRISLTIMIIFLTSLILFSFQTGAATPGTSIQINGSGVKITVVYKEIVTFVSHSLTDTNGNVFSFQGPPYAGQSDDIFLSNRWSLASGVYNYSITVTDSVGNYRTSWKVFEMVAYVTPPPPGCGDGIRNITTEECDDGNNINGDGCSDHCKQEFCGNSLVEGGEECDKTNLNGAACSDLDHYIGGSLSCNASCWFDTSKCYRETQFCGDGRVTPGEDCDIVLGVGDMTCNKVNSNLSGGPLLCSNCHYNTSKCTGPFYGFCGNKLVEKGESCDGGIGNKTCPDVNKAFTGGDLSCGDDCLFDTSKCTATPPSICGDGAKNQPSEECDGADLGGETCQSQGFISGNLKCTSSCKLDKSSCVPGSDPEVCGDSIVQKPNDAGFNEQCDGNPVGQSCPSPYTGGTLQCYGDCTYDYSGCTGGPTPKCGDGNKNLANEDCDGNDLGGQSCLSLGYASGSLKCYASTSSDPCKFDKSSCVKGNHTRVCGDTSVQKPNDAGFNEDCDGTNLNNKQCADVDKYTGGRLLCKGDCSFNYNNCTKNITEYCGDGIANGDEVCDGSDFGNITSCEDFAAFSGGIITCADSCHFDTSKCIPKPVQPNASCYDGNKNSPETDVDCGGGNCPRCANGKTCLLDTDCTSNYCKNNICTATSCTDGIKNGFESDTDCGGGSCPSCGADKNCNTDSDCLASLFCHPATKECTPSSCDDGYQNGDETGVDCGGGCTTKCGSNQGCISDADCMLGFECMGGVCSSNFNVDTDGDGMPDAWENRYGLDANDPSDADEDPDNDGRTNYQEYENGTDPLVPDGFPEKKNRTLQIILLILGLVLMLGSIGFLIYSRKVLVPQQRKAAAAQRAAQQPPPSLLRPTARPGMAPGMRPGGTPSRLAQRQAARKSLFKGFGPEQPPSKTGEAEVSEKKPAEAGAGGVAGVKKPSEEFIPLSKLEKAVQKPKPEDQKPKSEAFEKLKEFASQYKDKLKKKPQEKK